MKPGRAERKNRRLSSQNRKRSGRKKAEKEGERPKAKAEGEHLWNSCGSETGWDERKQTESQVPKTGKEAWETRRKRRWKAGKPKGRTEALDKPLRGKARKKGTEEQKAE